MSWISAETALSLLGTKPQTLYANVSRGRIGAKPDPHDPRRSLYRQDDVERLASRQKGRRPAKAVAAEAIAWGEPVLETSIATIRDGRLSYRGHGVEDLAQTASLEQVASILWGTDADLRFENGTALDTPGLSAVYRAMAALAANDMPTLGRAKAKLLEDAARVIGQLIGAMAGGTGHDLAHKRLSARWERPEVAEPLRAALVLLAEHELNASTFTARVTASTGAPLSAAILAGLAALSGPLHGNASQSMIGLLEEASRVGPQAAVAGHLRRGQPLPCFGHKLYPDGDMRAQVLLKTFKVPEIFEALAQASENLSGELPNIDFALAAMTMAYDLPEDAPLQIFAVARSVGWIAHALEQMETGALIRPRARYVGV